MAPWTCMWAMMAALSPWLTQTRHGGAPQSTTTSTSTSISWTYHARGTQLTRNAPPMTRQTTVKAATRSPPTFSPTMWLHLQQEFFAGAWSWEEDTTRSNKRDGGDYGKVHYRRPSTPSTVAASSDCPRESTVNLQPADITDTLQHEQLVIVRTSTMACA
eukprot:4681561-Amphidinium_carterae.1